MALVGSKQSLPTLGFGVGGFGGWAPGGNPGIFGDVLLPDGMGRSVLSVFLLPWGKLLLVGCWG